MSIIIKNGKHHTINMYSSLITYLFFLTLPGLTVKADATYAPKNDGQWIIVIDPGHGGSDPGALGKYTKEKNINLAIALKTGKYIEDNIPDAKVIYTRNDDSRVDLYERPEIAIRNKADLFISIHANWSQYSNVAGAETYIMGLTKDKENLEVAMKENEVILLEEDYSTRYEGFDPVSPESYIIFTLTQNLYQKQSTKFASMIQSQFSERAKRRDRGVRQAGFLVLYRTTMPSVLIETGYISNADEEKYLNSGQGQDYLASAIYRACRDYLNDIDIMSNISTAGSDSDEVPAEENPVASYYQQKVVFMVQIASSRRKTDIKPENFKGISEITEISSDRFRYATGSFYNYTDAVAHRKKIEALYPDAFVIAVRDNKILPLRETLDELRKNNNP